MAHAGKTEMEKEREIEFIYLRGPPTVRERDEENVKKRNQNTGLASVERLVNSVVEGDSLKLQSIAIPRLPCVLSMNISVDLWWVVWQKNCPFILLAKKYIYLRESEQTIH